jgi:hypothetical protein
LFVDEGGVGDKGVDKFCDEFVLNGIGSRFSVTEGAENAPQYLAPISEAVFVALKCGLEKA